MIIDKLENIGKYVPLNPLFQQAVDFLRAHRLDLLDTGKTELQGKDLLVNVTLINPKTQEEARLETHRDFIDIQIPVSGVEVMGYTPAADCQPADAPYNKEKDIAFYEGAAASYLTVEPGMFVIFFPQDGHAPGITPETIKKVIIKVKA